MPSKPGPGSINQLVRFPLIFTAASRSICCSLLCRANRGSPRPTRLRLPVCKTSHTTSTPACQRFRTGGGLWCHCIRQQHGISFFFFFCCLGCGGGCRNAPFHLHLHLITQPTTHQHAGSFRPVASNWDGGWTRRSSGIDKTMARPMRRIFGFIPHIPHAG